MKNRITRIIEYSHFLIYLLVYFYFVVDAIFMSDGHYLDLFSIFGTAITPRLFAFAILLFIFLLRVIFKKSVSISPFLLPFIMLFFYCTLSFILGYYKHGFSNAWLDYRSVMLILIIFPTIDIFNNKNIDIKKIYFVLSILMVLFSLFILYIYFYQIRNGYSYSYMTWIFGKTQNKYSSFLNLSFRQGFGVYHDALFYVTIFVSIDICVLFFLKNIKTFNRVCLVISMLIMLSAVLQSVTKGFIIFIIGVFFFCLIYSIVKYAKKRKNEGLSPFSKSFVITGLIITFCAISAVVIVSYFINVARLFDFTSDSTKIRLVFIKESFENIFKPSFLLGKFYGFHLPSKGEVHLEISLLEVLLKQGLVGFYLWLIPLFLVIRLIKGNSYLTKPHKIICYVLLLSVYIISLFNPHLCSVSGALVLSLTIAVIRFLSFSKHKTQNKMVFICFGESSIRVLDASKKDITVINRKISLRDIYLLINDLEASHVVFADKMITVEEFHELVDSLPLYDLVVGCKKNRTLFFKNALCKLGIVSKKIVNESILFSASAQSLFLIDKKFSSKTIDDAKELLGLIISSGSKSPYLILIRNVEQEAFNQIDYLKPDYICCLHFNYFYNTAFLFMNIKHFGVKKTFKGLFFKHKMQSTFYEIRI